MSEWVADIGGWEEMVYDRWMDGRTDGDGRMDWDERMYEMG